MCHILEVNRAREAGIGSAAGRGPGGVVGWGYWARLFLVGKILVVKAKRKAKRKRKRQDVILQRRLTILAALIVTFLIIPWLVPPQVDYLKPQMDLRTLGMVLSGTLIVPIAVWLDFWGLIDNPSMRFSVGWVVTLGLLPVVIWSMGWFLRIIWRSTWGVKIWVGSGIAVNLFCGLLVLLVSDPRVHDAVTCEKTITGDLSIRVVSYQEFGNGFQRPDHLLFFLMSRDNGQSWDQVFHTAHGKRADLFCPNFHVLDGTFFWTWTREYVVISQDGGRYWVFNRLYEGWDGEHQSIIRDVVFEDRETGNAILDVYPEDYLTAPKETLTYHTTDGGRTWARTDDATITDIAP